MNLPDEAVREFQKIYRDKVMKDVSWNEARLHAEDFLNLYELISQPIPLQQAEDKNANND